MSKDTPEVGDVWERDGIKNHITDVESYKEGGTVFYTTGFKSNFVSIEFFIKHFTYLGKSKANINDLFKTENGK